MKPEIVLIFQLAICAKALTFTSPSLEATWNSSGPHTLAWFIDSSDFLSGSMRIHFVNSLFSESILVVDQANIGLGTYTFDTVLPTGSSWTVQAAVYSIGDITHSNVLSSGQSGQFNIVDGGPSPKVSVTVINLSTLSTIGGTIFTAFTPGADFVTGSFIGATATGDGFGFTFTVDNTTPTPTPVVPSIAFNQATSSTTSHSATHAHNGLSLGTTIGIAVGVILVIIFLVSMASLYFLTKRRQTANKKIDDQAIQLSGRLGSHETFEKDVDTPTLKYGEDDADEEIMSGRTMTAFESHNIRG